MYSPAKQLSLLGAHGILSAKDLPTLNAGCKRVLALLMDSKWHDAEEVRVVAGGSEGLRRLRELRTHGYDIIKRRSSTDARLFEYRLGRLAA